MNLEAYIFNKVFSGEEANISMALLERQFGESFTEKRIELWAIGLIKKLGVKATIHFQSDVITFYPKV